MPLCSNYIWHAWFLKKKSIVFIKSLMLVPKSETLKDNSPMTMKITTSVYKSWSNQCIPVFRKDNHLFYLATIFVKTLCLPLARSGTIYYWIWRIKVVGRILEDKNRGAITGFGNLKKRSQQIHQVVLSSMMIASFKGLGGSKKRNKWNSYIF